ncbi:SRPBCC family protein [Sanguibacter sp. Z1732]|uniref:SRPBCC family protein n=1 Tax=Sanguibacter sp. Z1732 TaxID=3435412 RepID=UPI003D9CB6BB
MPITTVHKDTETLQITIVADFTVPVQRLWDAYADARQIEKFWGPVTWPATFTRHDMAPGGFSHYYMTGPEGERSGGYWEFLAVDPGRSFEVLDGFTGPDGNPDRDMPAMRMVYEFTETDTGSRCTTTTYFNSADNLKRMLTMGMEEGMRSAMSQIDDVVADLASLLRGPTGSGPDPLRHPGALLPDHPRHTPAGLGRPSGPGVAQALDARTGRMVDDLV